MTDSLDSSLDELTDAPLTAEQRTALNKLHQELESAQARNTELLKKLRQMEEEKAEDDSAVLTRPDFNREVARMLAFDKRYGGISSILYFDFSNLDETAAELGDDVANITAKEIATLLARNVRSSDIVGRLAPDEFGVLLMRCDNAPAWRKAETLASCLQDALNQLYDGALRIQVSYGAYTFREDEDIAVSLKQSAHTMLSVIK